MNGADLNQALDQARALHPTLSWSGENFADGFVIISANNGAKMNFGQRAFSVEETGIAVDVIVSRFNNLAGG